MKTPLLVLSSVLLATSASAAVLIVDDDEMRRNARSGSIEQYKGDGGSIGVKPEQVAVTEMTGLVNRVFLTEDFNQTLLAGMARDIALKDAMEMVVPKDWNVVYRISKDSQNLKVSWRGGVKWTDIVKEIMGEAKGYAFIDPQSKQVTVSASPENDLWEILPEDRSLRISLSRWVNLAGWQLVWDIDRDFDVEAGVKLNGTFKDSVGQIVSSLSRSDYPVRAVFYEKSKVLRVVKYTAGSRDQK